MYTLKPNHGCESPKFVASFDVETKQSRLPNGDWWLELLCWTMSLSRRGVRGDDAQWQPPRLWEGTTYQQAWAAFDEICEIAQHAKVPVGGHNIGFDWRVLGLDSYITQEGWSKPKPFNTGHPFLVKTRRGSTTLSFYSTTNLLPAKLEDLAPEFGMKKLGDELDKEHLDQYPLEEVLKYCRMDTLIVDKMQRDIIDHVRENHQGTFMLTVPGQGFHDWLHNDLPIADPISCYDSKGLMALEQMDLRGGRCEVNHLGKFEDCTQLDFVSLYPSVMADRDYPINPMAPSPLTQGKDAMLRYLADGAHVIAECAIELKKGFNFLGVKRKVAKQETLLFPIGRIFPAVLDGEELAFALAHPEGVTIKKVTKFVPYQLGNVGFKTYIARHAAGKLASKKGTYAYRNHKMSMNSLQGKMAQRYYGDMVDVSEEELPSVTQMMEDEESDAISRVDGGIYYHMGEKYFFAPAREKGKFAWHAAVRITGKVCSSGRMRLWEAMSCAGHDQYLNMDTDSLIVRPKGLECLEKGDFVKNVFGKMTIVEEDGRLLHHVNGIIYGNKHYIIDDIKKRKGVKKDAIEISPLVFQQKQFITGIRSYWLGDRFGVRVRVEQKDLNTPYTKGDVMKDNWVRPKVLAEW